MSFGKLFLPPGIERLQPDLKKIYDDLIDNELRQKITYPDPLLQQKSQEVGRLFNTGVDSEEVKHRLYRSKSSQSPVGRHEDVSKQQPRPSSSSLRRLSFDTHIPAHLLTLSETVRRSKIQQEDEKYAVSAIHDLYEPILEAKVTESVYNPYTPKMWSKDLQYPSMSTSSLGHYHPLLRSQPEHHTWGHEPASLSKAGPGSSAISSRPCSKAVSMTIGKQQSTQQATTAMTKQKEKKQKKQSQRQQQQRRQQQQQTAAGPPSLDYHISHTISSSSLQPTARQPTAQPQQPPLLSALQSTLTACGHLVYSECLPKQQAQQLVEKSIDHYHGSYMANHLSWLHKQQPTQPQQQIQQVAQHIAQHTVKDEDEGEDGEEHSHTSSLTATSQNKRNKKLPKQQQQAPSTAGPSAAVHTFANTRNPYRIHHDDHLYHHQQQQATSASSAAGASNQQQQQQQEMTSGAHHIRSKARLLPPLDPLMYKDDRLMKSLTNYTACLAIDVGYKQTPSRHEVSFALSQLTKKQILFYHARVVEIAALVKALLDRRHSSPGIQALWSLHHAFVNCACNIQMNPSLLAKRQMTIILQQQITGGQASSASSCWLAADSIARLLLSYDTTNTGILRYVRLSATCLATMVGTSVVGDRLVLSWQTSFSQAEDKRRYGRYILWERYGDPAGKKIQQEQRKEQARLLQDRPSNPYEVEGSGKGEEDEKGVKGRGDKKEAEEDDDDRMNRISNKLTEKEFLDMKRELMLLRFLFQLYAESQGFPYNASSSNSDSTSTRYHAMYAFSCKNDYFKYPFFLYTRDDPHQQAIKEMKNKQQQKKSSENSESGVSESGGVSELPTMKIEELRELFCCCVSSVDDETIMDELLAPFHIFLLHRKISFPMTDLNRPLKQQLLEKEYKEYYGPPPIYVDGKDIRLKTVKKEASNTSVAATYDGSYSASMTKGNGGGQSVSSGTSLTTIGILSEQKQPQSFHIKPTLNVEKLHPSIPVMTILNHPQLKTMFTQLTITENQFMQALFHHGDLLREFVKQVRKYRDAVKPYLYSNEALTLEDSLSRLSSSQHIDPLKID